MHEDKEQLKATINFESNILMLIISLHELKHMLQIKIPIMPYKDMRMHIT